MANSAERYCIFTARELYAYVVPGWNVRSHLDICAKNDFYIFVPINLDLWTSNLSQLLLF